MPQIPVPPGAPIIAAVDAVAAVDDLKVDIHMFLDLNALGDPGQLKKVDGDNTWKWNTDGRGAYMMVNNDDDGARNAADNADNVVNGNDDKSDLAPIKVWLDHNAVPAHWDVFLKVNRPNRIRIFKSDAKDATEIIGPSTADEYKITDAGMLNDLKGVGGLKLRMEGMRYADVGFDGLVNLSLRIKDKNANKNYQDSVEIKVAPWMILHHGVPAKQVYVARVGDNQRFRTELKNAVQAAGAKLVESTLVTENLADENALYDLRADYGTDTVFNNNPDWTQIFQPAVIAIPEEYNYDDGGDRTMANIAARLRDNLGGAGAGMTGPQLLDFKGVKNISNMNYLVSQNAAAGWVYTPEYWKLDDASADALGKMAARFDPATTVVDLLKADCGGQTNFKRLFKAANIKIPRKYNYDKNADLTLAQIADRMRANLADVGGMAEAALRLYTGNSAPPKTNAAYLAEQGDGSAGWVYVTEFWNANSDDYNDLDKMAKRFGDPAVTLTQLLEMQEAGISNAARIFKQETIKIPRKYNFDKAADRSLDNLRKRLRTARVGVLEPTLPEFLNYKGTSAPNIANAKTLWNQTPITRGMLQVKPYWDVDDVTQASLTKLAERFEDPPYSVSELLNLKEAGTKNGERLWKVGTAVDRGYSDRWMQDCMEIGSSNLPNHRMDAVMRATRRGDDLRKYVESLRGKDFGFYSPPQNDISSFDSSGNLEVTPPCAAGGKDYKWGRIYYGPGRKDRKWNKVNPADDTTWICTGWEATWDATEQFDPDVAEFFDQQEVQKPFKLDTSWLRVGHVDEMMTWVPNENAPPRAAFPYKLLFASAKLAYDTLKAKVATAGQGGILMRRPSKLQLGSPRANVESPTIADFFATGIGSHAHFKDWQDEAQGYLDDVLQEIKNETGVQANEIVEVPILFEKSRNGLFDAITAGMVNMLVIKGVGAADGGHGVAPAHTHCIIPKPYGPVVGGDDLYEKHVGDALLAMNLVPVFIDDWDEYHARRGEIHCGTNTLRMIKDNQLNQLEWWKYDP